MTTARLLAGAFAVLLAMQWQCVQAAPGDVFVAAHRTKDGSYVPANVPPSSGGTHAAERPRKGTAGPSRTSRSPYLPPLLVDARPIVK